MKEYLRVAALLAVIGVIVIGLSACGVAPIKADPLPTVVQVPVITPCIDAMPEKPQFYTDAQMLDGSDYQVVVNLRLDRDQRRIYEADLEAKMLACVKPLEQSK